MAHIWLNSALVFSLVLLASLGCKRMESESLDLTFSELETAEDVQAAVDEATSHADSILLVHVSWAPMIQQRKRFAEFQRDYKSRYPTSNLAFRYIDCTPVTTGYEPLRTLPGWKELEEKNNGTSLVHGYGEIVWCKNGRVLHVERPLDFASPEALITKTESLENGSIAE